LDKNRFDKKLSLKKATIAILSESQKFNIIGGTYVTQCIPTIFAWDCYTLPIDKCDTPTIRDFTCLIDGGCDSGRCTEECGETKAFSNCGYCPQPPIQ